MIVKFKKIFMFTIILFTVLIFLKCPVRAEENKKVLILNSYNPGLQWTKDIQRGIENTLKIEDKLTLYHEFMDLKYRSNNNKYIEMLYDLYKEKYKGIKFDTIICSDNDALNFMVRYGEEIFGRCSVVFCGINDFDKSILKGKTNFTGITEKINVLSTIVSIINIQPCIKNVAIICDSTTTGKINEEIARESILKVNSHIKFYFYRDLKSTEVSKRIGSLGKDTALLNIGQLKSEDGEYILYEKTQKILSNLNKPVYICWDFLLDNKTIGGNVIGGYDQGKGAAEIALRILKGEDIKNIPIVKECKSNYIFDYNELNRYRVELKNLQREYTIINKPFSFYETYKKEIIIIIGIILFLLIFIVILISNIKRRIQIEKELRKNYNELNSVYGELASTEEELEGQYNELQISEERYKALAFYDQLTGLPNKYMFLEEFSYKFKKNQDVGALFLIDIDNFKNINDTLGHDYGDEFLKYISREFLQMLKDDEFICRFGGDEFLLLKSGTKDRNQIKETANEILNLFKKPFNINGKRIFTTASIGISVFPEDGLNEKELFKNSDIAMYKAKEMGKNRYLFYDVNMAKDIVRKSLLIDGLRDAIEKSEFKLLYQPQLNLSSGEIEGAEVLLRWTSSEVGSICPAEFIPLTEQTEFIVPIGKWILKKACLKNKEWIDSGFNPIVISVNVSVTQLQQYDFLQSIKEILEETNLPSKYLEIEITESVMMSQMKKNLDILNEIKKLGIKIALDDFGTGYSSLSYLRLLPINKLKLDKSFIDNIHINKNDKSIVEGIVKLAHKMDVSVIAEGVELKEQLDILNEIKCDSIQGYYFSKPISPNELEKLLKYKSELFMNLD